MIYVKKQKTTVRVTGDPTDVALFYTIFQNAIWSGCWDVKNLDDSGFRRQVVGRYDAIRNGDGVYLDTRNDDTAKAVDTAILAIDKLGVDVEYEEGE